MSPYDTAFNDPYEMYGQVEWGSSEGVPPLERVRYPALLAVISTLTYGLFNLFWYYKNTPLYIALSGRNWHNHKQLFWIHVGLNPPGIALSVVSPAMGMVFFAISLAAWAVYVKEFLACRDVIAQRYGVVGLRPANEILSVRIGLGVAGLISMYLWNFTIAGYLLAWGLWIASDLMYWLYTYWILTGNNRLAQDSDRVQVQASPYY